MNSKSALIARNLLYSTVAMLCTNPCGAQVCDPSYERSVNGDNLDPFSSFANAVAIDGNFAAVGWSNFDHEDFFDSFVSSGAVHMYRYDGTNWTSSQMPILFPVDEDDDNNFGSSVAISGDVLIAGSPNGDTRVLNKGDADVFRRVSDTVWAHETVLTAFNTFGYTDEQFGTSVAVFGDVIAVGDSGTDDITHGRTQSGSTFLYRYNGTDWIEFDRLSPLIFYDYGQFGSSVALDGNVLVVGARGMHNDNGVTTGGIYIYRFQGGSLNLEATITPIDGQSSDLFGESVAISGNTIVVGSRFHDEFGSNFGAAYFYQYDGANWTMIAKVNDSQGQVDDYFGTSVDISGQNAVVGSPYNDFNGPDAGLIYTYTIDGATVTPLAITRDDPSQDGARFGSGVAISGTDILTTVPAWDYIYPPQSPTPIYNNPNVGRASFFDVKCPPCLADLNGDDALDFFDVSEFLTAFGVQDPVADFTDDGSFDFFDVSAFLAAFSAGCP